MMFSIKKISAVAFLAAGLTACGSDNDSGTSNNSSSVASSSSSSVASSSSSSVADNIMEVGVEYPFDDNTVITNTGTTDLIVTKKFLWESGETVVILEEGIATID